MKSAAEATGAVEPGRGALQLRRMSGMTPAGAAGKANVGISNDKGCEIHPRRKAKVSRATSIAPG